MEEARPRLYLLDLEEARPRLYLIGMEAPPPVGWENPTGRESRTRWKSSFPGRFVKVKKAKSPKIPAHGQSIPAQGQGIPGRRDISNRCCIIAVICRDSRSRTKNLQTARRKKDSQIGGNSHFCQPRISDALRLWVAFPRGGLNHVRGVCSTLFRLP